MLQAEKPVCLLCHEAVSVVKEYNLRRHFDTKDGAKYRERKTADCLKIKRRTAITAENVHKMQSQQKMFTKAIAKNEAAVTASFIVAE